MAKNSWGSLLFIVVFYHSVVLNRLARARTIFIAKSPGANSPSEFRPISITSVIQRQLHRILAVRLNEVSPSNEQQVAFKNVDGISKNIGVLRTLLDHSKANRQDLHIISMDLQKAFDSVNHSAIIAMAKSKGFPKEFVEYLITLYSNAETQLQFEGVSKDVRIGRGVFQGCPLSPLLFNLAIDSTLEALHEDFGYKLNDTRVKCTAFADDVNIFGGSVAGVQLNVNTCVNQLSKIGLKANPSKCKSLSLVVDGKHKRTVVDTRDKFTVAVEDSQFVISPIHPSTEWKYLGIKLIGEKLDKQLPNIKLHLNRLDQALLKPQQKLEVLNAVVLPQLVHKATFSDVSKEELSSTDKLVRGYVRKWLHLPHDVPKAYIHAPIKLGGMGMFELSIRIPLSRRKRLLRFSVGSPVEESIRETQFYRSTMKRFDNILNEYEATNEVEDPDLIAKIYFKALDRKWCTKGLTQASACKSSRAWLGSKSDKVSPADFVKYNLISSNSLPTLARRNWGRGEQNVKCRHGCSKSETAHHILQECTLTHGMRVKRHDRLVELIYEGLINKWVDSVEIEKEPHFNTSVGMRKPDLVIYGQESSALVIDIHVVGRYELGIRNVEKAEKYRSIAGFSELVKSRYGVEKVSYHAITVNYAGIIEKSSSELLLELGFSKVFLHVLATSVLRGSWVSWSMFNHRYKTKYLD